MADRGMADETLFRLWLDGARAFARAVGAGGDGGGRDDPPDGGGGEEWRRAEQLFSAWSRFIEAMASMHEARAGASGASPFDPAGWLRAPGDGGMADLWRWFEGPDFADFFAEERRVIAEWREWLQWTAAAEQYRAVMAGGWLRAFRRFAEALAARAGNGDGTSEAGSEDAGEAAPPAGWDGVVALWREIADAELARTQRSEAYLAAQRDLLAAELALRARLRSRADRLAAFFGLPTRAEIDDLQETVHGLRREIRALRREMRSAAGPGPGPADDAPGSANGRAGEAGG